METPVNNEMELAVLRRRCPRDAAILYPTVDEDGTPIWQCPECSYYEFDE